jgi:hypothetical protein
MTIAADELHELCHEASLVIVHLLNIASFV